MKVSIIIPVYNAASRIEATLQSVLDQTFSDYEVLLVDDHGTDDSMSVAQRFIQARCLSSRFRFLQTTKNAGPGVARNVGIEAAEGKYIAFLDSDDLWHKDFLQKLVAQADAADTDLCYCQLTYKGGKQDGCIHRNPVLRAGVLSASDRKHFLCRFVTFSVCFLFRRAFLQEHELRFPSERNSEDTNFLTRCLLLAERVACVDEPLYVYWVQEGSLSTGHNPDKWKLRLSALGKLMEAYREMRQNPKYTARNLGQYRGVMWFVYLKKGLLMALRDLV